MRLFTMSLLIITVLSHLACGGGGGSGESTDSVSVSSLELTTSEYEALPSLDKYKVINKLLAALYKGSAAADFFDLTSGMEPLVMHHDAITIGEIRSQLMQPMFFKGPTLYKIDRIYSFHEKAKPIQYPLAMLYEFDLSRDYLAIWMAYRLANSILFSPALELETCDYTDIQKVFQRLVRQIENGDSIRDVVYEHMISQENWRRFRSPEDNTREMMEIFLGRFRDDEVPLASLACQNWSLSDDSDDYQLIIGYNDNTEPQSILDTTVTSCTDFYRAVADHTDLIPHIASILVKIFLTDASPAIQQSVVDTIVSEDPREFKDIFIPIIFSREFLMDTERPAHLEERFFNIAHRISWFASTNFFKDINHAYSSSTYPSLKNMKQAALTYKLGRRAEVPLDTLSFSYFHKSIRERLLLDQKKDYNKESDGGWLDAFLDVDLENDEFIKYLFVNIISRFPTEVELNTLSEIMTSRNYTQAKHVVHRAMIVMDYLSRLSETYYLNALD